MGSRDTEEPELLPIGRVVAALRRTHPDVTHSSLRFLEREGLVEPTRTPGGHRLYAPRDVDRVRQIKAWQAQRLSLEEIRQRLAAHPALESPAVVAERFLRLALAGDPAAASEAVLRADEAGTPLARLFEDVLRPALYEVGERWADGSLPVGQEKEVSELARDLITELSLRHARPDPHGPTAVAACVAGERHDLGLRMVVGLLRARGWRVHFLGADVATPFLLEAVALRDPTVVLLSGALEHRLPAVAEAIDALRTADARRRAPRIIVGGQATTEHAAAVESWGAVLAADERLDAVVDGALAGLAANHQGRTAAP